MKLSLSADVMMVYKQYYKNSKTKKKKPPGTKWL